MARPRKDAPTAGATQRMRDAFWHVLACKPYTAISVNDIVQEADVNKNTLYYHYGCVEDLAWDCVRAAIPAELAEQIFMGAMPKELVKNPDFAKYGPLFKKLTLLAGPQGCGILPELLRSVLVEFWLGKFGLEPGDLLPEERMLCSFASSGVVGLLGSSGDCAPQEFASFLSTPFANGAIREALGALGRAAARKQERQTSPWELDVVAPTETDGRSRDERG